MESEGGKIGDLARRTGLTVRTLHHYHAIGLLVPTLHSRGEHRRYSRADLVRLQEIRSLRALGLSLREIADVLDRKDHSPLETIERHLAAVEEELDRGRRLRARLEHVARLLRTDQEVSVEDLVQTIEDTVMYEEYYTPEQLAQLRQRGAEVDAERIQEVQREWAELFRELAAAQRDGAAPESERARALALRARDLVEEFTGGDAGIRASLAEMYRHEGGSQVVERHGMDVAPGVFEYTGAAMNALEPPG